THPATFGVLNAPSPLSGLYRQPRSTAPTDTSSISNLGTLRRSVSSRLPFTKRSISNAPIRQRPFGPL
ncbi:MAG TPA: hypothetical protein V6D06_10075, partial [Trichocoleus sp.]